MAVSDIRAAQLNEEQLAALVLDALQRTDVENGTVTSVRQPDYVRRDEHIVRVILQAGGFDSDGTDDERWTNLQTAFDMIMRGQDHIGGSLAALHRSVANLGERITNQENALAGFANMIRDAIHDVGSVETQTYSEPNLDTAYTKPIIVEPQPSFTRGTNVQSPLDVYLTDRDITQEQLAKRFQMRVSNMRNLLWAEAAARNLKGAMQERCSLGHSKGGQKAQANTAARIRRELEAEYASR